MDFSLLPDDELIEYMKYNARLSNSFGKMGGDTWYFVACDAATELERRNYYVTNSWSVRKRA